MFLYLSICALCFAPTISREEIEAIQSSIHNIYVAEVSTSIWQTIASIGIFFSLRCLARTIMVRVENLIESNVMPLLPPQTIGVPFREPLGVVSEHPPITTQGEIV